MREISYREAVREAMAEEMERDERVFLMGEEVGLSSRMADLSRPLASAGVAGAMTFRPGTYAYRFSTACECWAAS